MINNIYVFIKHWFFKRLFRVTGNWKHFSIIFPFDWNKSFSLAIFPVKHIATNDWQLLRRDIVSQLSHTIYSSSKMISLLQFGNVYCEFKFFILTAEIRTEMVVSLFSSKLSFSVCILRIQIFHIDRRNSYWDGGVTLFI